jgi:hypothetical protein
MEIERGQSCRDAEALEREREHRLVAEVRRERDPAHDPALGVRIQQAVARGGMVDRGEAPQSALVVRHRRPFAAHARRRERCAARNRAVDSGNPDHRTRTCDGFGEDLVVRPQRRQALSERAVAPAECLGNAVG